VAKRKSISHVEADIYRVAASYEYYMTILAKSGVVLNGGISI
jgi:hypothetical protein